LKLSKLIDFFVGISLYPFYFIYSVVISLQSFVPLKCDKLSIIISSGFFEHH